MLKKKEENKDYKESDSRVFWKSFHNGVQLKDPPKFGHLIYDEAGQFDFDSLIGISKSKPFDYKVQVYGAGGEVEESIKHPRKVLSIKKGDI